MGRGSLVGKIGFNVTCFRDNEECYEGEWENNLKHGEGLMIYTNRETLRGTWFKDNLQYIHNESDATHTVYDSNDTSLYDNQKYNL